MVGTSDCPAPFEHSSNVWRTSCFMSPPFPSLKLDTGFPRFPCSKGTGVWPGFHQSGALACDCDWEVSSRRKEACRFCYLASAATKALGSSGTLPPEFLAFTPEHHAAWAGRCPCKQRWRPTSDSRGVWAVVAPAEYWTLFLLVNSQAWSQTLSASVNYLLAFN